MNILFCIVLFIIASIGAAFEGDWSGMEVIGKVVLFIVLFFVMAYIMINPALLVIVIILFVVILIACSSK